MIKLLRKIWHHAERQELREIAAAHGIDLDAEEARWDRAREIAREREEHEYDDLPELEPGEPVVNKRQHSETPPSSQDPMASVPQIEYEMLSDDDDDDDKHSGPNSPETDSQDDDDSDFEH